jgi:hypothetical protein
VAKSLGSMSVGDLQSELKQRERRGAALLRERERLAMRLLEIDQELAGLGVARRSHRGPHKGPGRVGPRFRNDIPLHEALAKVIGKRSMSIGDAIVAVRRSGYRSTARNFRLVVSVALANRKRFRRVKRSIYAVR